MQQRVGEREFVELEVRWFANHQIVLGSGLLAGGLACFIPREPKLLGILFLIPWGIYELWSGLRRRKEVGKELFRVSVGETVRWKERDGQAREVLLKDLKEVAFWDNESLPHIYFELANGQQVTFNPLRFSQWKELLEELETRFSGSFRVNGIVITKPVREAVYPRRKAR